MPDIAFLVYKPLKQRRKDNSFDGNDNIGALVIADVLQRAGHAVGFCGPETAKDYKIVLVSFTSTYDLIAFYSEVALLPSWQPGKRTFTIVAGGFGMQNPTTCRNFIDYAVFGRAEGFVCDLIAAIIGGGTYQHASVMNLPELHRVILCQAEKMYPHKIHLGRNIDWQESLIGCPGKCKFCHYTWARKKIGEEIYVKNDMGKNIKRKSEIMWKDLKDFESVTSIVLTALDGCTEKLRFAYGKNVKNTEIAEGINHIAAVAEKGTGLDIYNIVNFPGETEEDIKELENEICKANPEKPVAIRIQSTPFRASILTPMQHCAVNIEPRAYNLRNKTIIKRGNLRAFHSVTNEGPYSQLIISIIERATPESDKLFHTLCFSPKLKARDAMGKIRLLERNFDLKPYLRRYAHEEMHPAWFLSSYTPPDKIHNISKWMEKQMVKGAVV